MVGGKPTRERTSPALLLVLSPARRRGGLLLLGLMLLGAVAELASVVMIVPFLNLVAGQRQGTVLTFLLKLGRSSGLGALEPVTLAGLALGAVALGSAAIRIVVLRASQSFVFTLGQELSSRTFAAVLHQPLSYHLERNSSAAIAALQACTTLIRDFMLPVMQGIVAAVIAAFVILAMLLVSPGAALVAISAAGLMYGVIAAVLGARLRRTGQVIVAAQTARLKTVQEGIGGIRDVLIGCAQQVYLEAFDRHNREVGAMLVRASFAANAPRIFIEALGVIGIAMLTVSMSRHDGGLIGSLPQLAALALALLKLVPLLGQVFAGWAQARSSRAPLADVLAYIALPIPPPPSARLPFERCIELRSISFAYRPDAPATLDRIDLRVDKGEVLGIVGRTGSGKSTLLDVLLGLLPPSDGSLSIDGQRLAPEDATAWQLDVAHVPQAIYLLDSSIAENIAFASVAAAIDRQRLKRAAERAQLGEFIGQLADGYETRVGERGIRLSGGQRQRIGIARALYREASLLVLDEATSALDEETEAAVMQAICTPADRPTVIIAAHRASTLRHCSRVYRISGGVLSEEPGRA